jgi:hypothetical protein
MQWGLTQFHIFLHRIARSYLLQLGRFTLTSNGHPDTNQLFRLVLKVCCSYQNATDEAVTILYFCSINVSSDIPIRKIVWIQIRRKWRPENHIWKMAVHSTTHIS